MPTINEWKANHQYQLPEERKVIERNKAITSRYAQLYQMEPQLYKWAGMASFASYHVGDKLQMLDWDQTEIQPLSVICNKKSRSIKDDFQVIRIVNNTIFDDIGWVHLAFCKMDFSDFKSLLSQEVHYQKMLPAFEKLNDIKEMMKQGDHINLNQNLIWEANSDILWHEQAAVVQPLFDQLSSFFSRAMTFCASFDYKINQNTTNWKTHSRFILFMLFNGFDMVKKTWLIPEVTNLQHRWFWIENDLLEKWKIAEADYINTNNKIKALDAAGK